MSWLRQVARRWRALFNRRQLEEELAAEVDAHLDLFREESLRRGMSPEEARNAALRAFGGVEQMKEAYRDQRGIPFLETLCQDIRFASRLLERAPVFTAVVVLTLALAIGANTAFFSVIYSVLLSPLPFPDSDRLAYVESYWSAEDYGASSGPDYLDWAHRATTWEGLCATTAVQPSLTGGGEPLALRGLQVSTNFFDVIEPRMTVGRGFLSSDGLPGQPRVTVLSQQLWRSRFDADRQIVGRVITVDGAPYTVVGVSSARMGFLEKTAQIYLPLQRERLLRQRGEHYLAVLGRRKPDVTWPQVRAEMAAIAGQLQNGYPENRGKTIRIHPLHPFLVANLRTTLLVLYGAVTVLLGIACVNVSSLLLAKASTRTRELAVRRALGAGRWRIARQLLTESLMLSLLGGLLGLFLAYNGIAFLRWIVTAIDLPGGVGLTGLEHMRLDLPMLAFTLLLSLAVGVFFGTVPAWQMSQRSLVTTLKEAGQASHSPARHRTMASLVVVQLALSVALLSAAGLLMRSYLRLQGGNPGFDTRRLLALRVVRPNTPANGEAGLRTDFFQHATAELAALPGVTATAAVSLPPISRDNSNTSIRISGLASTIARQPWAELRSVSAGYFACLGIPLLRGRAFDAHDTADNRRVAVISQELARRYFPDRDPLGRSVGFDGFDWTIVGVVGDVTLRSLRSAVPDPALYRPITQHCERQMTLFVRTIGDPLKWAEPARRAIAAVDPDQPILDTHTMTDLAMASLFVERSSMYLLTLLASLSLLIGSVGFYAVLSSVVDDSRGEIAVRIALGADSAQVFRLVLRRGLSLTAPGLAIGLAVAGSVGRLMRKLVYNVASPDPVTLALVALVLLGVALLACYLPARRAARLDPIEALKCD